MYLPILFPPPEQERLPVTNTVPPSASNHIYRHDAPRLDDKVADTPPWAWPLTQKQALTAAWWRSVTKSQDLDHPDPDGQAAAEDEDADEYHHLLATMDDSLWTARTGRGSFKRYRRRNVLAPARRARILAEEEEALDQVARDLNAAGPQRRQGKGKDDGDGKGKSKHATAREDLLFPLLVAA